MHFAVVSVDKSFLEDMFMKRLTLALIVLFVSLVTISPLVFANEEAKACKADADCEHGEHCKDGHCHKA